MPARVRFLGQMIPRYLFNFFEKRLSSVGVIFSNGVLKTGCGCMGVCGARGSVLYIMILVPVRDFFRTPVHGHFPGVNANAWCASPVIKREQYPTTIRVAQVGT